MTDQDRNQDQDIDLSAALSRLRTDVRRTVAPPAATQLRDRADRRLRARRTATVLVAAGLVGAALIGGGLIWSGAAPKPPPVPAESATPTPSGTPSAAPRPSKPVAARQTPQAPAAWAGVNWATATITFPAHPGCPSGPITLRTLQLFGSDAIAGPVSWPRVTISPESVVYGDLTGDGQAEAVLDAACLKSEEDSGDGQGQLLVLRRDGGTLRTVAWVGPRGSLFGDKWVAGGRLFTDVKPRYGEWEYQLGAARAYRWTGQAFTEVADSGYSGMVPRAGATAPAVDLTAIAALTGCPAAVLRFGDDGQATGAGTTWDVQQPTAPDYLQHLVDLDGDGRRRLLVAITCGRADTPPGRSFVAVLEPQTDGSFRAVDAVLPPAGMSLGGWMHRSGTLTLQFAPAGGGFVQELPYTWNGEYFQR